jgi:hypothetical protein
MHLLIPFAACKDPASRQVLRGLQLPHLEQLIHRLSALPLEPGLADSPSLPHERVLAQALGLPATDPIPWAAWQAAHNGHETRDTAWAHITPSHWQVEQAQVTLLDPQQLALSEDESRTLLAAMQPYFEEDGITLVFDSPGGWLARGEVFRNLSTASLQRVVGRDVASWMPASAALRRLQNEMQMLLYTHPQHDARVARGALPVNSFWVSGSGALQAAPPAPAQPPIVPQQLIQPALQQDWQGWAQAWQALDAAECAALLAALDRGANPVQLTLCGEQHALPYVNAPRRGWARIKTMFDRPALADVWEQL